MGIFNRQKVKTPVLDNIPTLPHTHTWKDMPWYMEVWYNTKDKTAGYSIIEPYICITCGERKDVTLETLKWTGIEVAEREHYYKMIRKRYAKYLKPRAVVEDMINNILLVKDPVHLEHVELMRGSPHINCGSSAEMKQVFEKENDIGKLIVPKETEK